MALSCPACCSRRTDEASSSSWARSLVISGSSGTRLRRFEMAFCGPAEHRLRRRTPADGMADDDRLVIAERFLLDDEAAHHAAHLQHLRGDKGTVLVAVDLLAHHAFGLEHADTQGPDLLSDFVDAVVHGDGSPFGEWKHKNKT